MSQKKYAAPGEQVLLHQDRRTKNVQRQVIYSFGIKAVSVVVGLMLVPLLLDSLNPARYAIWITLSSMFAWFSFFDLGLGNGLRNKLAEALANNDRVLARELVSTTYAIVGSIFVAILAIFHLVNPHVNWQWILNARSIPADELFAVTTTVFGFFFLRFIAQLIGVIYIAAQKPSANNALIAFGNLLAFILIVITVKVGGGSLLLYCALLVGVPLLVLVVANVLAFSGEFGFLRPSWSAVRRCHARSLLNLGVMFLVAQIGAVVLFSTYNILILQLFNAHEVVVFTAAFTYFQLPVVAYGIVMGPIWSAVTDAFAREDHAWMASSLKKLNMLSAVFICGIVAMTLLAPFVYEIWLGGRLKVPFIVSLSMAAFAALNVVLAPYTSYVNGIGRMKVTTIVVTVSLFVYFPLAIYLAKALDSSAGIMFATCIVNAVGLYFQPRQVGLLLGGRATGIWAK